jgi:hypothetical protein
VLHNSDSQHFEQNPGLDTPFQDFVKTFKFHLSLICESLADCIDRYLYPISQAFSLRNLHSLFSFFSGSESPEKPTLKFFGIEGTEPVHSLDTIILKIQEIEDLCSTSFGRNSSSSNSLDSFIGHKKSLIETLTSHEVHVCLSVCICLSVCLCVCLCVCLSMFLLTISFFSGTSYFCIY